MAIFGAICFGAVVGWMAHVAFWNAKNVNIQWLASMLGVIGGGAVTAMFESERLFGGYCIGMAALFFLRMLLFSPLLIWRARRWFPEEFHEVARELESRTRSDDVNQ